MPVDLVHFALNLLREDLEPDRGASNRTPALWLGLAAADGPRGSIANVSQPECLAVGLTLAPPALELQDLELRMDAAPNPEDEDDDGPHSPATGAQIVDGLQVLLWRAGALRRLRLYLWVLHMPPGAIRAALSQLPVTLEDLTVELCLLPPRPRPASEAASRRRQLLRREHLPTPPASANAAAPSGPRRSTAAAVDGSSSDSTRATTSTAAWTASLGGWVAGGRAPHR